MFDFGIVTVLVLYPVTCPFVTVNESIAVNVSPSAGVTDDVVGVTIPDDSVAKETVVLKFDAERFPYAVSKPIHHSQKIVSEKDCILQIEVRPNKELESVIFSYFPHVEVLAPVSLREDFKEKIVNNLKKYTTMQNGCTDDLYFCTKI
jgi:hypothetical protein